LAPFPSHCQTVVDLLLYLFWRSFLAELIDMEPDFSSKDLYKNLGLSRQATEKDIKKAYYKLARKYHPDKNSGNPQAAEIFKKVGEAYSVLSDPDKKRNYDTTGSADGSAWAGAARHSRGATSTRNMDEYMNMFANFDRMFGGGFFGEFGSDDAFFDVGFGGGFGSFGRDRRGRSAPMNSSRGAQHARRPFGGRSMISSMFDDFDDMDEGGFFSSGFDGGFGGGFGGSGFTSSFSSSSFSTGGGGVSRSVSTTMRTGPDGKVYKTTKTSVRGPDGRVETSQSSDVLDRNDLRSLRDRGNTSSRFSRLTDYY